MEGILSQFALADSGLTEFEWLCKQAGRCTRDLQAWQGRRPGCRAGRVHQGGRAPLPAAPRPVVQVGGCQGSPVHLEGWHDGGSPPEGAQAALSGQCPGGPLLEHRGQALRPMLAECRRASTCGRVRRCTIRGRPTRWHRPPGRLRSDVLGRGRPAGQDSRGPLRGHPGCLLQRAPGDRLGPPHGHGAAARPLRQAGHVRACRTGGTPAPSRAGPRLWLGMGCAMGGGRPWPTGTGGPGSR